MLNLDPIVSDFDSTEKTASDLANEYLKERNEVMQWLLDNGFPPLSVVPEQKGTQFTGKNPSYLDRDGKPHLIKHSTYQTRMPTQDELDLWFANPAMGIGTLGGWNNTIWLDFDLKRFPDQNQEKCDNSINSLLKFHPELKQSVVERTQSGGWRIGVRVKEQPDFKNLTLFSPGGDHLGEAIGAGGFTVLAPTIGPSGNSYQNIHRGQLVELDSLESIRVYKAGSSKNKDAEPKTKQPKSPKVSVDSAIPLEKLLTGKAPAVLEGENVADDHSESLTILIKESYGWQNWCEANDIDYESTVEELAHIAGENLRIDPARVDRIIKTVEADECHPAVLHEGEEDSCWIKIKSVDKSVFNKKCPPEIKNSVKQNHNDNLQLEFEPTMVKLENILQVEDPARQMWEVEKLSKQTKIQSKKLIEIHVARKNSSREFKPKDVPEFLAKNSEDRKWIVASHISVGTTLLLYADGGVGKTLLCYDLCKAIATGQAWNGFLVKQGKVLIIQTDEAEIDTAERLSIAGFKDLPQGVVHIESNWQFTQVRQLKRYIEKEKPLFVVIDSLSSANRSSTTEEKDAAYASVLFELRDIANEYKCSIMVVHHESKTGGARGTTAVRNNVGEVWRLHKGDKLSPTQRVLNVEKSRSGCYGKYLIELNIENYSWLHKGEFDSQNSDGPQSKTKIESLFDFLKENPGVVYLPEDLVPDFGNSKDGVRKLLERLKKKGQIESQIREKPSSRGNKINYKVYFYPELSSSAEKPTVSGFEWWTPVLDKGDNTVPVVQESSMVVQQSLDGVLDQLADNTQSELPDNTESVQEHIQEWCPPVEPLPDKHLNTAGQTELENTQIFSETALASDPSSLSPQEFAEFINEISGSFAEVQELKAIYPQKFKEASKYVQPQVKQKITIASELLKCENKDDYNKLQNQYHYGLINAAIKTLTKKQQNEVNEIIIPF